MKDLITVWKHTRTVVLVALTAAVYAALLIPFKVGIPIIPGFTEVRPANVIPVVCSLMFGPAAAWGAAFGNLVADIFGTFGPGSAFGFVGNLLYGYLPYKLWGRLWLLSSRREPLLDSGQLTEYAAVAMVTSAACALTIGWGVHALSLVHFALLGPAILLNNALISLVLGPPLMRVLYRRVRRWGLVYHEVMPAEDLSRGRFAPLGVILLLLTAIPGVIVGTVLGPWYPQLSVTVTLAPLVALMLLGCALL